MATTVPTQSKIDAIELLSIFIIQKNEKSKNCKARRGEHTYVRARQEGKGRERYAQRKMEL